jgi:hypothetical protein
LFPLLNAPVGTVAVKVDPDGCGPTVVEPMMLPPVTHHSNVAETGEPSGSVSCACSFGWVVFTNGRAEPMTQVVDGVVDRLVTCGVPLNVTTAYGSWPASVESNFFHELWVPSLAARSPIVIAGLWVSAPNWKKPVAGADTQPSLHDAL